MLRVANLKRIMIIDKWKLPIKFTNLGNSFPEYFFVGVFSDFPSVVCRLQNQLDLLHYPVLSLHFLQKLERKNSLIFNSKVVRATLTFSLTAISTAEFGTSSIILSLSSTTFILTFFFPVELGPVSIFPPVITTPACIRVYLN